MGLKKTKKLGVDNPLLNADGTGPGELVPGGTPPPPTSELLQLPLDTITESSTNPRKQFEAKALAELADNIALNGVMEPIIVRPATAAGQVVPGRWELICGARRLRAAKKVGLASIPALVRAADDVKMLPLQLAENIHRDDLRALERSNAHQQMAKRGLSVDQIAVETSTSPATVRDSLKLQDLVPEVRKVWGEGEIDYSRALEIAKVPAQLQTQVLAFALEPDREGDKPSVRGLRDHIRARFMLDLKRAPFPVGDAELVPKAGACSACPMRTGAQPEFFTHVGSADVCINKVCYQSKCDAFLARSQKEGRTVLAPTKAKQVFNKWDNEPQYSSDFVLAEKKEYGAKKAFGDLVEPDQVVLAQNPHTGAVVELVPKAALPKPKPQSNPYEAENRKWREQRAIDGQARKLAAAAVVAAVAKKVSAGISEQVWRKLALQLTKAHWRVADIAKQRQWPDGWEKTELPKLSLGETQLFVIDTLAGLDDLAEVVGVDQDALEAKALAEVKAEFKEKAVAKKKSKAKKGKAA